MSSKLCNSHTQGERALQIKRKMVCFWFWGEFSLLISSYDVTHCTGCYKAGPCVSMISSLHLLIQKPGGCVVKSGRTSFFVSSVLLPEPARCTTQNIPLQTNSYPFTLTFLGSCINPWTVCPIILHTRKLIFAPSKGRSWVFSPSSLWLRSYLLQKVRWCRKRKALFGLNPKREHGDSLWFGQVRHKLDLDVGTLCSGFRHLTSNCSVCSLRWLQGIWPDMIWRADNNTLVITAAAGCD